jgi:hypothetical protein
MTSREARIAAQNKEAAMRVWLFRWAGDWLPPETVDAPMPARVWREDNGLVEVYADRFRDPYRDPSLGWRLLARTLREFNR